jgi:hypothetical protein
MDSTNRLTYLSGYGIVGGAQRAYDAIGPLSVLLGAASAYGAWQWLSDSSRQSLRPPTARKWPRRPRRTTIRRPALALDVPLNRIDQAEDEQ